MIRAPKQRAPLRQIVAPWRLRWRAWRKGAQLVYISTRHGSDVRVSYAEQWEDPWGNVSLRAHANWKDPKNPGKLILQPSGTVVDGGLSEFTKWCPYDREERAAMMLTWGSGSSHGEQEGNAAGPAQSYRPYKPSYHTYVE